MISNPPDQAYPEDGITAALSNVLDFEQQQGDIWEMVVSILHKHGIPFGARPVSNVSPRWETYKLSYLLIDTQPET